MKTASERGKSSRRKGATFERRVAADIKERTGLEVRRNLKQYQKSQEGDLDMVGPFLIECKDHKEFSKKAWWEQAATAAKAIGAVPAVAYNAHGRNGIRYIVPYTSAQGDEWSWEYEYTIEVSAACFAMIVRESL